MLDIDLKAEGTAHEIACELHSVICKITEKIPKVAIILYELASEDDD